MEIGKTRLRKVGGGRFDLLAKEEDCQTHENHKKKRERLNKIEQRDQKELLDPNNWKGHTMQGEEAQVMVTEKITVAKYADGVTQEEINAGTVEPYEVIEIEGEPTTWKGDIDGIN